MLGPLQVLLFYGLQQFDVQVEHLLATRVNIHRLAQMMGHNACGVAVQLAQGRVVGGIDQPLVKHQVAANIGIELTVIVLTTGIERLMQQAQVFVGAAQGRRMAASTSMM